MSKSKSLAPGAYEVLNGTLIHLTWSLLKPSCAATAYATADSKPLPLAGSLSTNHGSYAGESVPTVSWPAVLSGSVSVAHASASAVLLAPDESAGSAAEDPPSDSGAQAAAPRTRGRTAATARARRRVGRRLRMGEG